jgi:anti-anti-sigma factor
MFKLNFNFKTKNKDNNLIFIFDGELDKYALSKHKFEINELINNFNKDAIIFDFEKLVYINSESIGYLIQINDFLKEKGIKFALVGVRKNVKDILNAIGILEVIPSFNNYLEFINS